MKKIQTLLIHFLLNNNMRIYIAIVALLCSLSSCDSNINDEKIHLKIINKINVEENESVIFSNPCNFEVLNDSVCLLLNNSNMVVVYNSKTGLIKESFSYPNLNFDSIFYSQLATFSHLNKEYSKEIKNEYGLLEEFIQSIYYDKINDQLILHFYKLYPYYNSKIKKKTKQNSIVFSFQPFLIYLDMNGGFKKIVTVNSEIPFKPNLVPAFSWGFNIFNDTLFVQNWTENFNNNQLLLKYVLENNSLVFKGTSYTFPPDYKLSLETYFYNDSNVMYYSDQKNIYTNPSNKKIKLEEQLTNEYIQKMKVLDDKLFFISRYSDKKEIKTYLNYIDSQTDELVRVDSVETFLNNYAFYGTNIFSLIYDSKNEKYQFIKYEINSKN